MTYFARDLILSRDTIFGATVLAKTVTPAWVLQLKQFAEVLLTGLTFKKIKKKVKKILENYLRF